jgi:hypothetical protein
MYCQSFPTGFEKITSAATMSIRKQYGFASADWGGKGAASTSLRLPDISSQQKNLGKGCRVGSR